MYVGATSLCDRKALRASKVLLHDMCGNHSAYWDILAWSRKHLLRGKTEIYIYIYIYIYIMHIIYVYICLHII